MLGVMGGGSPPLGVLAYSSVLDPYYRIPTPHTPRPLKLKQSRRSTQGNYTCSTPRIEVDVFLQHRNYDVRPLWRRLLATFGKCVDAESVGVSSAASTWYPLPLERSRLLPLGINPHEHQFFSSVAQLVIVVSIDWLTVQCTRSRRCALSDALSSHPPNVCGDEYLCVRFQGQGEGKKGDAGHRDGPL